ncbi:hypothetical protein GOACH_26_00470 [Gordonia aichiensis NBRC 108223]|uniref:Uncharacterized protein n=1 Tax=Gordonia aichiensis NBRC 108223 TaxID=1220583 RepID=L7KP06_9ACTN|nr:hypothetical protein GOACH_26_00470 [Gordonia aichiensis NBRC 108223]
MLHEISKSPTAAMTTSIVHGLRTFKDWIAVMISRPSTGVDGGIVLTNRTFDHIRAGQGCGRFGGGAGDQPPVAGRAAEFVDEQAHVWQGTSCPSDVPPGYEHPEQQ